MLNNALKKDRKSAGPHLKLLTLFTFVVNVHHFRARSAPVVPDTVLCD